jgi:hypothetical protein
MCDYQSSKRSKQMTNRKTIAKNRHAAFFPKITSAKSYRLDNFFKGQEITHLNEMADYALRLSPKVWIDPATHTGQIHYHDNHWIEFAYQA